ncbi:MAG: respiratory nitrate reductase subunit gamma [Thermodesulfobacteriota bacterium]
MSMADTLLFMVLPYVSLAVFVTGHVYRYTMKGYDWNAQSTELLDKGSLRYGITVFHWGILATVAGHAGGLLIPQRYYDAVGISGQAHTRLAVYSGFVIGALAFVGLAMLLIRRWMRPRVRATTSANDLITLILLLLTVGLGLYNVAFGHFYVLDTIAPWIRGIVFLSPDPSLMSKVPVSYKAHIVAAFIAFGFSPFSRLVHIWSAPVTYLIRSHIVYRRLPRVGG